MSNTAPSAQEALRLIGLEDDQDIAMAEAALWLAQWAEPDLKREPYRRHLQTLVDDVAAYVADDGDDDRLVLEGVRQILARRYGYAGASDPAERAQAANLARTIDHRRGSAAALAILYTHAFQALGRTVNILTFPVRPMIGVQTRTSRIIIDPFNGGQVMSARDLRLLLKEQQGEQGELNPGSLTPLSRRQVLLALQHDIKVHHLRHAAPEAALQSLEGALLIAPDAADLWRELGLLHARQDHIADAIEALERFLQLPGREAQRYTASQLLQQLRHRFEKGDR